MAHVAKITQLTNIDTTTGGRVKGQSNGQWVVDTGSGVVLAKTAFSCLVTPEVDDQVVLVNDAGGCFILAILAREQCQQMSLSMGSQVTANVSDGNMTVSCSETFAVRSKVADIANESMQVSTVKADMFCTDARVMGQQLTTRFDTVKRFATAVLDVCDSATRKLKNCFKHVEGVEQHQSKDTIHTVKNNLTVRSHHANISARKEMKIDGERIHMG